MQPFTVYNAIQQVYKQRDHWRVEARQNKEALEKFRIGYETREQKHKELSEEKTKEAQTLAKLKEKLALCGESLEMTVKILTGDTANVCTCTQKLCQ